MNEYISKKEMLKNLTDDLENHSGKDNLTAAFIMKRFIKYVEKFPAANVQPLSVVAEHIKNRLYETALNTNEAVARNTIVDIAERIDFWVNELKSDDKKEGAKNE